MWLRGKFPSLATMSALHFDTQQSHFALFGLPPAFRLDLRQLERDYRTWQTQVHPDKAAHLPAAEQLLAMQQASWINEAYQTLRSPLRRARYLLNLHGIDTQEETNTAMPMDFLMAQMEKREAVVDAKRAQDFAQLDDLNAQVEQEVADLTTQLAIYLDDTQDYAPAAAAVRKLRFMEKLGEDILAAYDEIESG